MVRLKNSEKMNRLAARYKNRVLRKLSGEIWLKDLFKAPPSFKKISLKYMKDSQLHLKSHTFFTEGKLLDKKKILDWANHHYQCPFYFFINATQLRMEFSTMSLIAWSV